MVANDLGGQIPKIEDGPWPQFPADLTSIAVAVATQAQGTVLVYEKMFENRLVFTDKLVTMGARIVSATRTGAWSPGLRGCTASASSARHPRRHGDADRRRWRPRAPP